MASRREELGSWLEGTPTGRGQGGGSGLGLPSRGPGSLAPVGRRVLALVVDWGLSLAISTAFFDGHPMATLAIFAASTAVLLTTLGHTIGHRLLGLGVARLADLRSSAEGGRTAPGTPQAAIRRAPGLVPALLRTVLLCLVIPAAIWDGEGRGMHDVAAGTVILRR